MTKPLAILSAFVAAGIGVAADAAGHRAQARMPNILNSPGYQRQLEASRKAYADEVAASQAPQVTHRTARKKKAGKR